MNHITLTKLNYMECARYLGYGKNAPDEMTEKLMRECESELLDCAVPRFVYKIFDIERQNDKIRLSGTKLWLTGASIKEHLAGCSRLILLCATLSDRVDKLIRKTELKDMAKALVMDAMAGVAVEQVCDKAEEHIRDEYLKKCHDLQYDHAYFTWRFGFGYGDLPLEEEPMALNLLDAGKRIGVHINDSLIMFPRKTVTCIIGISKEEIKSYKKGCVSCNMRDRCKFRLRGERCGF